MTRYYLPPCDAKITDTYQGHKKRHSLEPGTDYGCAYGTPLVAPYAGRVSVVDSNNGGAEGRRVSIDLADGRRVSFIHCSRIIVGVGHSVVAGETVAYSGASGFGEDWYYGPHVHVSLWPSPGMAYSKTIDFEPFTVDVPNPKPPIVEDDEMTVSLAVEIKPGVFHLFTAGKEFLSHNITKAQSTITKNLNSATDELHEITPEEFKLYCDGMGIPQNVYDLKTGWVVNPQNNNKLEANGTWSRVREGVAETTKLNNKIDELLKKLADK